MDMIERKLTPLVRKAASQYPSVTLFGPRQSGKTTLAKSCVPGFSYANLEHLATRALAEADPDAFFRRFCLKKNFSSCFFRPLV